MSAFRTTAVVAAMLALFAVPAIARTTPPAKETAQRIDPYKNFTYRLIWRGRIVAAFGTSNDDWVEPDVVKPEVVKHRAGGDPSTAHKSPGRTKFEAITLERGLTQDSKFSEWAAAAHGSENLVLERYDANGKLLTSRRLHGCLASEFHAGAPNGTERSIERITLRCDSPSDV
jgi:phage tail-like protein